MTVNAAVRLKVLGGALLGALVAITVVTLVSARREAPNPVTESLMLSRRAAGRRTAGAGPSPLALARPGRMDLLLPPG